MKPLNTDDLELQINNLIEAWRDGERNERAVIGPIQALARTLIFAHDLYRAVAESSGELMSDETQLAHMRTIIEEELPYVHEISKVTVRRKLDS